MTIRIWASATGSTNNGEKLALTKDDLLRDGSNKVLKSFVIADGAYSSTNGSTMDFSSAAGYSWSNTGSWNAVKTVKVAGSTADLNGNALNLYNIVHTHVVLNGNDNATVNIDGAKRGTVRTDDGNDTVNIGVTSNGGWTEFFKVNTRDGDDNVTFTPAVDKGWGGNVTTGAGLTIKSNLGDGNDSFDASALLATTTVAGGNGSDTIVGGGGADDLRGGDDADSLTGNDGNDTLRGGNGADTLVAGAGDDLVGGGDDNDYIDGGDGNDDLRGADGNDTILGGEDNDTLRGHDGDDSLDGGNGEDLLLGGQGNDTLAGKGGSDLIKGHNGDDHLNGGQGADTIFGGNGNDNLIGANNGDELFGQNGDDTLSGGNGGDVLNGGRDNDSAEGGNGNDLLVGANGDDSLSGGADVDTLDGGRGNDNLTGGSEADIFFFKGNFGHDVITDFELGGGDLMRFDNLNPNKMDVTFDGTDSLVSFNNGNRTITVEGVDLVNPSDNVVFSQGFETDVAGWLDSDDAWQGSTTRVASGTDGITSADGSFHAIFEQDATSAPFTRFDGYRDTWTGTYKASVDIYLDTNWDLGEGFDYSVASSGSDGGHQRDFIFHVTKDTSTGDLLVGGSNNTNFDPREDLESINHYEVTSSDWYTFEHVFQEAGDGTLEVDLNLYDSAGTLLFTETRNNASDIIATEIGGNRYGWFTNIDIDGGIAVDNTELAFEGTTAPTGWYEFV